MSCDLRARATAPLAISKPAFDPQAWDCINDGYHSQKKQGRRSPQVWDSSVIYSGTQCSAGGEGAHAGAGGSSRSWESASGGWSGSGRRAGGERAVSWRAQRGLGQKRVGAGGGDLRVCLCPCGGLESAAVFYMKWRGTGVRLSVFFKYEVIT